MTRAAAALVALVAAQGARADALDRLAVEWLEGETPRAAAEAFERACWRAAIPIAAADPLQTLEFAGTRWVRLGIAGPASAVRCLDALEPGRRAIDGTYQWFDRVEGGLILPAAQADERVPLAVLVDETRAIAPAPLDAPLVDALAGGEAEAQLKLAALEEEAALATVRRVLAREGPQAQAALERVAKDHPSWRVRREAMAGLDPELNLAFAIARASDDPAWEVRLAAVEAIGSAAPASLLAGGTDRLALVSRALVGRLESDAAWEVRRAAIWQLPTTLVLEEKTTLERAATTDADARVRAVALETLAVTGLVKTDVLRKTLGDAAPAVRAVAAAQLARDLEPRDAPALWQALHDDERLVRIAASGFLDRIDDETIGPDLWRLYLEEMDELDADPAYLTAILAALARRPFPNLAMLLEARLAGPLDPTERRLLARAYAQVTPERAAQLYRQLFSAPDASRRSIAADAAPDTSETRALRLKLLDDPDAEVRAGALLGLCRVPGALPPEKARDVRLEPVGLGAQAIAAAQQCGEAPPVVLRFTTRLGVAELLTVMSERSEDAAFWPAVIALLLLVVSVVGIKLGQRPPQT